MHVDTLRASTTPTPSPFALRRCADCHEPHLVAGMSFDGRYWFCAVCASHERAGMAQLLTAMYGISDAGEIAMDAIDKSATYYHDSALEATEPPVPSLWESPRYAMLRHPETGARRSTARSQRLHSQNLGAAVVASEAEKRTNRWMLAAALGFVLLAALACWSLLPKIDHQHRTGQLRETGFAAPAPLVARGERER